MAMNVKPSTIIFLHDNDLLSYSKQFLKVLPRFNETKMAIFFKGKQILGMGLWI